MLRRGTLPAERREHALDVIVRNAANQETLIAELLDVSQIASGRLTLESAHFCPLDVVKMAVESVHTAAEAKRLEIVPSYAWPMAPVLGDAARLQQAVTNLLTNAVRFSPKREVSLRGHRRARTAEGLDRGPRPRTGHRRVGLATRAPCSWSSSSRAARACSRPLPVREGDRSRVRARRGPR